MLFCYRPNDCKISVTKVNERCIVYRFRNTFKNHELKNKNCVTPKTYFKSGI